MKVKLLAVWNVKQPGQIVELSDNQAKALIDAGFAEITKDADGRRKVQTPGRGPVVNRDAE